MVELPTRVLWYGVDQPLAERHLLRAGPLTMLLENGTLRSIKLGDKEIVRGIYAAVRDKNWGTIEPRFLSYEIEAREDAFVVHFIAEHKNAEVAFTWQGTIRGTADGVLQFIFDGRAQHSFLKNRIGFCVLHPMELAGVAVEVDTPQGTEQSIFPIRIAPHQPFKDIIAIRFAASPESRIEMRFEGDLFEMEDQRNWTDASYKTYCTPLRLPFPVEIAKDERIYQAITLNVLDAVPVSVSTQPTRTQLRVSKQVVGNMPRIGFGVASHGQPLTEKEVRHLRLLQPAHLWAEIDLRGSHWQDLLLQAWQQANTLGAALELSVICDDEGACIAALIATIAHEHMTVARLFLFPSSTFVTTEKLAQQAHTQLQEAGINLLLGCGSRANFAEFNRASLPLSHVDVAGYAINPQVHAFDNASLIETLAAQAVSVTNAKELVGSRPLSIGPITLKPRFNAAATSTIVDAVQQDVLPETVDARQMSFFAAGWTIGSIYHLTTVDTKWLTYYETTGWRGLMERSEETEQVFPFSRLAGAVFPLYHVFADLVEFAHAQLLGLETSEEGMIEALALRKDERFLLLLANITNVLQVVTVQVPPLILPRIRILDESTAELALFESETFRQTTWQNLVYTQNSLQLELQPYAFVRLDATIKDE